MTWLSKSDASPVGVSPRQGIGYATKCHWPSFAVTLGCLEQPVLARGNQVRDFTLLGEEDPAIVYAPQSKCRLASRRRAAPMR